MSQIDPSQQLVLRPLDAEWDAPWDSLAGQAMESGFMQSSAWAAFKRSEGYLTPRYGLFQRNSSECIEESIEEGLEEGLEEGIKENIQNGDREGENDALVGGGTLYLYPYGPDSGFVVCPEGPVLPWDEPEIARAGLRLLIAEAQRLATEYGALGLRIEPHIPPPRPSLLRNWSRAPVDLTPVHSLILDLTLSDEEIRARMHPKGRYNLGLSRRHGVEVRVSQDMADLHRFYDLFIETAQRNRFFAEPYGFFLNLGTALFPTESAVLLLAEWQGQTVAGLLEVFYGRRATYLYGASSAQHRAVMPNFALHARAFQEARQRGCTEYDFYGYDPFGQPDHLYAGFSRFKMQWGAERRDSLGAYDLIFYDHLADRLVQHLRHSH